SVKEPLRMLAHPGMIRRGLNREVERDLEAPARRGLHEPVEVVERAEVGMHRGVAAVGGTDGPWAAGLARLRRERVVAALAVRPTDGVDRRQIDDVEAHRGRAVELGLRILERPVTPFAATAARKELVPGGEARALAVGDDLEFAGRPCRRGAIDV